MTIGLPDSKMGAFVVNAEYFWNHNIVCFGDVNIRKGTSYALYRAPYWISDPNNLLHEAGTTYNGFQPTFETDIFDNLGSIIRSNVFGVFQFNGWF
jgi:iron complex outermembrane receptor protein